MIPEYKEKIALRISTAERKQIDTFVKTGKFKTISQVIRQAIAIFLANQQVKKL
jgi:Arc/MetJ-type ribon-helix-helix transcriptional regulator